MALFWSCMSYHTQRYMFQSYMLCYLLTQSFNIVNTQIILLFSKKWVPGFAAEDNRHTAMDMSATSCSNDCKQLKLSHRPGWLASIMEGDSMVNITLLYLLVAV